MDCELSAELRAELSDYCASRVRGQALESVMLSIRHGSARNWEHFVDQTNESPRGYADDKACVFSD
jgi:hypothetical protein